MPAPEPHDACAGTSSDAVVAVAGVVGAAVAALAAEQWPFEADPEGDRSATLIYYYDSQSPLTGQARWLRWTGFHCGHHSRCTTTTGRIPWKPPRYNPIPG